MRKQVDKSHYAFAKYMTKARWSSIWHQLNEVIALRPESVLEVGPGNGIFKSAATVFGLNVKTLDVDAELSPDYVGSVTDIPLPDRSVDVACAFQVLEHMPYEVSLLALRELNRVAKRALVISLPDARTSWPSAVCIPKIGMVCFVVPCPWFKPVPHAFDGEHYWEVSKKNYPPSRIITDITNITRPAHIRTFRVHDNQYHRFFVVVR